MSKGSVLGAIVGVAAFFIAGPAGAVLWSATGAAFAAVGMAVGAAAEASIAANKLKKAFAGTDVENAQMYRQADPIRSGFYGTAKISGPMFYIDEHDKAGAYTADNEYLVIGIILADHRIDAIEEIYINDELAWKANAGASLIDNAAGHNYRGGFSRWFPNGVYQGKFSHGNETDPYTLAGHAKDYEHDFQVDFRLGNQGPQSQQSSTKLGPVGLLPYADGAAVGSNSFDYEQDISAGCAVLVCRFKKNDELFSAGIPNISVLARGKLVYDSRDVTQTADDEDSWKWSDNLSLNILDYCRFESGVGVLNDEIDWDGWEADADLSDTIVSNANSADEKLYTLNGAFSKGALPADVLGNFLINSDGRLHYSGGKYRLQSDSYQIPSGVVITEDDVIGDIGIMPFTRRQNLCNTVTVQYLNKNDNYSRVDAPEYANPAYIAEDDGEVITHDISAPYAKSEFQALRIAKLYMEKIRAGETLDLPVNPKFYGIRAGSNLVVNMPSIGINNKVYHVNEWEYLLTGGVKLSLKEDAEAIHDVTTLTYTTTDLAPNLQLPNPTLVPTVKNLTVTNIDDDGHYNSRLNWDEVSTAGVYTYDVEVYDDSNNVVWSIESLRLPTTYINKLPAGNYTVKVYAVNRHKNRSNTPAIEVLVTDTPNPVNNMLFGAIGNYSITVKPYAAVKGVQTNFVVLRSTDAVFSNAVEVGQGSTEVIDNSLSHNTTYYYWAYTKNPYGDTLANKLGPVSVTTLNDVTVGGILADTDTVNSIVNGTNLALAAVITSSEASFNAADKAELVDGVTWIGSGYAAPTDNVPCWIQADLGEVKFVAQSWAYWYAQDNRTYSYAIATSDDGTTWTWHMGNGDATGVVSSYVQSRDAVDNFRDTGIELPTINRLMTFARYIRIYANGNSVNAGNHWYEWELWASVPRTDPYVAALPSGLVAPLKVKPSQPTIQSIVESAARVLTVTIDTQASDNATRYELWSSVGSDVTVNYQLVSSIPNDSISDDGIWAVVDSSYDKRAKIYYRAYAVNRGVYSIAGTDNYDLINDIPDPSSVTLAIGAFEYSLTWVNPNDPILKEVEVWVEARTSSSGFMEANAIKAYAGLGTSFTYEVPVADRDKYHQFWLISLEKV